MKLPCSFCQTRQPADSADDTASLLDTPTPSRVCRDSQGFCCSCTYSEAVAATLGTGSTDVTRANLDCDVFTEYSLFNGIAGSASCLRFDPLWYQV